MSKLTWGMAIWGLAVAGIGFAQEGPETFFTTDAQLLRTVQTNEAALDSQVAAKAFEIRGIAKKILKTETGDYIVQFAPDAQTADNFVKLQIDCEFNKDQRDALGALKLPIGLTIRGAVKDSRWEPKYDNHRYYKVVVRDAQITETTPLLR